MMGSLLKALAGCAVLVGVDGRTPNGDAGRAMKGESGRVPNGDVMSWVVCLDKAGIDGSAPESRLGTAGSRLTSLVAVPATPTFARSFKARFLSSFANAVITVLKTILCRRLSIFLLQYLDNPPSALGMWCQRKSM